MSRIVDWLDERTGIRGLLSHALDEPIPGGARFSYVFGSCLLFVLILQIATGVLMASFYAPSATTAWASVAYLQDQLSLGWFVRGLHSAGASAMVMLLGLHILQVAVWGAYKKPRELNFIVGVLLFALTLGFALTGYLLPWDQKGYWATQVATGLLGAMPLFGDAAKKLLLGGDAYGNLTLTHFYALHVFVLPGSVILLSAVHVALMRRHGVTPSWSDSDEQLEKHTAPFYPDQLLRDVLAMAAVLALLVYSVIRSHGATLEAPADPTSAYDARPEWYFLPLFQLLKLFPGAAEIPAAMGAPLLLFGVLLALPFVDNGPERAPKKRLAPLLAVAALFAATVGLGVAASRQDAASPAYQKQRLRADKEAKRARRLALVGVPASGGMAVFENDPKAQARKLYQARCAGCHQLDGAGENFAPTLDGWGSRAYIARFLHDPSSLDFFGKTKIHGMKPVAAVGEEEKALVEFIYSQGEPPEQERGKGGAQRENPGEREPRGAPVDAALQQKGATLVKEMDCDQCHELDGTSGGEGPNLGGRGSAEWLRAFLRDPSEAHFYGKKNEMPKFGEKLSPSEIDALAQLLADQRARD